MKNWARKIIIYPTSNWANRWTKIIIEKLFYSLQMGVEDFQLMNNETTDISILKRDFLKLYHQQEAQFKDSD